MLNRRKAFIIIIGIFAVAGILYLWRCNSQLILNQPITQRQSLPKVNRQSLPKVNSPYPASKRTNQQTNATLDRIRAETGLQNDLTKNDRLLYHVTPLASSSSSSLNLENQRKKQIIAKFDNISTHLLDNFDLSKNEYTVTHRTHNEIVAADNIDSAVVTNVKRVNPIADCKYDTTNKRDMNHIENTKPIQFLMPLQPSKSKTSNIAHGAVGDINDVDNVLYDNNFLDKVEKIEKNLKNDPSPINKTPRNRQLAAINDPQYRDSQTKIKSSKYTKDTQDTNLNEKKTDATSKRKNIRREKQRIKIKEDLAIPECKLSRSHVTKTPRKNVNKTRSTEISAMIVPVNWAPLNVNLATSDSHVVEHPRNISVSDLDISKTHSQIGVKPLNKILTPASLQNPYASLIHKEYSEAKSANGTAGRNQQNTMETSQCNLGKISKEQAMQQVNTILDQLKNLKDKKVTIKDFEKMHNEYDAHPCKHTWNFTKEEMKNFALKAVEDWGLLNKFALYSVWKDYENMLKKTNRQFFA